MKSKLLKRFVESLLLWIGKTAEKDTVPLFDKPFYADITEARIKHLDSLELPLAGKSVIDVGCGIGRFSAYFDSMGCEVFCVDGRSENIDKLKELYPAQEASVVDLETDQLIHCGEFDVVFCYGLLYHLADPFGFLKNASKICREMLIMETYILDSDLPVVRLMDENEENVTQSMHGVGCRPSPTYISKCLRFAGFRHVYSPVTLPEHFQFHFKPANDYSYLRDGKSIRAIFIASRERIENPLLKQL